MITTTHMNDLCGFFDLGRVRVWNSLWQTFFDLLQAMLESVHALIDGLGGFCEGGVRSVDSLSGLRWERRGPRSAVADHGGDNCQHTQSHREYPRRHPGIHYRFQAL
jgi:hypothetical protein